MPTTNTVALDSDNFISINGERFFPFGFYLKETQDFDLMREHVKVLGEAGFNTVQIEPHNSNRVEGVFDEAEAQGMKVIFSPVKGFGPDSTYLSNVIDDLSQESSLLAYTIGDDVKDGKMHGRPKDVGEVKEFHDSIKAQDPDHLTFVAIGGGGTKTIYDERAWDVGGREIYPVNGGSFISATFDFTRRNVIESEKNGQAAIAVLQSWDYDVLQNPDNEPVDSNRLPTPDEFANMTYQSLVSGVQGIIFYAYDYYDTGIIDDPERFAAASDVAQQVETLSPFLVSGTHQLTTLAHQLHLATWEVGNEFVAAIVYSGDYQTFDDPSENALLTKEVTFELPEGYEFSDVNNLFDDETFAQTNDDGTVTVTIDRLDVQVSRFEKAEAVASLGNDYLVGTVSADNLDGLSGNDIISGRDGDDVLRGGEGNDEIKGGEGDDDLYSGSGSDVVYAGAGNDYVRVGGGKESFHGGEGQDYISYYDSTNGVNINLQTNAVSGSWAVNDTISGFEGVSGSKTGDDVIYGTSGSNTIKTYGGDDKVYAGKGKDKVELGAGNDYVKVGGGAESFDGGSGKDYISYYDSTNGINIDLRADTVSGSWAVNDTINDFESASGSKTGSDKMYGTGGSNTLKSYGGNDSLYGRGGNDKMYGGSGDDKLFGGSGADRLDGGAGTDRLFGGNGADVFHFDKGEDHDTIRDFENNVDVIELDNFMFAAGQDAFDFADQVGSDVLFDFGGGDTLTVENVTIGQLANDLVIV